MAGPVELDIVLPSSKALIPNNIEIVFNWVKLRVRIQICMCMRYIRDFWLHSQKLKSIAHQPSTYRRRIRAYCRHAVIVVTFFGNGHKQSERRRCGPGIKLPRSRHSYLSVLAIHVGKWRYAKVGCNRSFWSRQSKLKMDDLLSLL
jgi:hypothetical protein